MASLINIGIQKIELGAVAGDGGMGTTLAALGYTLEGSAQLNMEDPQETDFMVEEVDTPIFVSAKLGKITLAFTVADPDEDALVKVFGGTKTGTGSATTWDFPLTPIVIENSIKLTPQKGMGFNIPRAKIAAKFTPNIGRAGLLGVEVTATILQPTKPNTPSLSTFRAV